MDRRRRRQRKNQQQIERLLRRSAAIGVLKRAQKRLLLTRTLVKHSKMSGDGPSGDVAATKKTDVFAQFDCSTGLFRMDEKSLEALERALDDDVTTKTGQRLYKEIVVCFVETLFRQTDRGIAAASEFQLFRSELDRILEKIVGIAVAKLREDCLVAVGVLSLTLCPTSLYHMVQRPPLLLRPDDDHRDVIVVDRHRVFPESSLGKLISRFVLCGGFEQIKTRILEAAHKSREIDGDLFEIYVGFMASLAGFLNEQTRQTHLVPVVLVTLDFLRQLPGKIANTSYTRYIEQLVEPVDFLELEIVDRAVLGLVVEMFKSDSLVVKEQAIHEFSRLVRRGKRMELIMSVFRQNQLLPLMVVNSIYRPSIQQTTELVLQLMAKENLLEPDDLDIIWSFHQGRQAGVARNARDMMIGVFVCGEGLVFERGFAILKRFWNSKDPIAQTEICRLTARLIDLDKEIDRSREILGFVWGLLEEAESSPVTDLLVYAFEHIFKSTLNRFSSSSSGKFNGIRCLVDQPWIKSEFLVLFVSVIRQNSLLSLLAIKLIYSVLDHCGGGEVFEIRYGASHLSESVSRAELIRALVSEHNLLENLCQNLKWTQQHHSMESIPRAGHSEQIEHRLSLVLYLVQRGIGIRMTRTDLDAVWDALVVNQHTNDDQEVFFDFIVKLAGSQRSCDIIGCFHEHIYDRTIRSLDVRKFGFCSARALWALFGVHYLGTVDMDDVDDMANMFSQRIRNVLTSDFRGREFMWKLIVYCEDERNSKWLRTQLIKAYSNRLILRTRNFNSFLNQCLAQFENYRNQPSSTLLRIASALIEHVVYCDRYFAEKRLNSDRLIDRFINTYVTVHFEPYYLKRDESGDEESDAATSSPSPRITLQFHRRNTFGQLRRSIEQHLKVKPYEIVLRLASCVLKPAIDDQKLFKTAIDNEIVVSYEIDDNPETGALLSSPSNINEEFDIPSLRIADSLYERLLSLANSVDDPAFSQTIHNILLQCPVPRAIEDSLETMIRKLSGRLPDDRQTIEKFFSGFGSVYRAQILYQFLNVYAECNENRIELVRRFYERGGIEFVMNLLSSQFVSDPKTRFHALTISLMMIHHVVSIVLKRKGGRPTQFVHPRIAESVPMNAIADLNVHLLFRLAINSSDSDDAEIATKSIGVLQSGFALEHEDFVDPWKSEEVVELFMLNALLKTQSTKVQNAAGELVVSVVVDFANHGRCQFASTITQTLLRLLQQNSELENLFEPFRTACLIVQSSEFASFSSKDFVVKQMQTIVGLTSSIPQSTMAGHFELCASLLKHESDAYVQSIQSCILFINDFCLNTRAVYVQRQCCLCGQQAETGTVGVVRELEPLCQDPGCRRAAYSLLAELCRTSENLALYRTAVHSRSSSVRCSRCSNEIPPFFADHESPSSPVFDLRIRATDMFVGLKNAGATCYVNAILQQMFMNRGIRELVLGSSFPPEPPESSVSTSAVGGGNSVVSFPEENRSNGSETSLTVHLDEDDDHTVLTSFTDSNLQDQALEAFNCLQLTFAFLKHYIGAVYNPQEFLSTFKFFGQDINPFEQHDAVEFLQILIDTIDRAFGAFKLPAVFTRTFGGEFETITACRKCGNRSSRSEEFCFVSVDVVNARDLVESLHHYTGGEILEGLNSYECEHCKTKVEANMKTKFRRAGQSLGFQLKRFIDGPGTNAHKYNRRFEFGQTLSMAPFMCSEAIEEYGGPEAFDYELKGVVIHAGGLAHGHYFSLIKNDGSLLGLKDRWYKFDDSDVNLIENFDQVLEKCCFGSRGDPGNAYMLFYERNWSEVDLRELGNISSTSPFLELIPGDKQSRMIDGVPESIWRGVHHKNLRVLDQELYSRSEFYTFTARFLKRSAPPHSIGFDTASLENSKDHETSDQINYMRVYTALEAISPLFQGLVSSIDSIRLESAADRGQRNLPAFVRNVSAEILEGIMACACRSASARSVFLTKISPYTILVEFLSNPNRNLRNRFAYVLEALVVRQAATAQNPDSLVPLGSVLNSVAAIVQRHLEHKNHVRHLAGVMELMSRLLERGPKTYQALVQLSFPQRLVQAILCSSSTQQQPTNIFADYQEDQQIIADFVRQSLPIIAPAILVLLRMLRSPRSSTLNPFALFATNQLANSSTDEFCDLGDDKTSALLASKSFIRLLLSHELVFHSETESYLCLIQYENELSSMMIVGLLLQTISYDLDFKKKRLLESSIDPYQLMPGLRLLRSFARINDSIRDRRLDLVLNGFNDHEDVSVAIRGLYDELSDWCCVSAHTTILVIVLLMDVLDSAPERIPANDPTVKTSWKCGLERIRKLRAEQMPAASNQRTPIDLIIDRSQAFLAKFEHQV